MRAVRGVWEQSLLETMRLAAAGDDNEQVLPVTPRHHIRVEHVFKPETSLIAPLPYGSNIFGVRQYAKNDDDCPPSSTLTSTL